MTVQDSKDPGREPGRLAGRGVVVTGGAGFIGSHVVEALLGRGARVTVLDDFDAWYGPDRKRANLDAASGSADFDLVEGDAAATAAAHLRDAELVVHLAGRPGVQDSWGSGFAAALRRNVELTKAIFEEALAAGVRRVVHASSSSIYGETAVPGGMRTPAPVSPYGVTKLAAEHLAEVYRARGLDIVCLRYFTVYGPRQRPDMAMHRMFSACGRGDDVFVLRGDGLQRREFTHVGDVAAATVAALTAPAAANRTLDIGGGTSVDLRTVMAMIERITGTPMPHVAHPAPSGDPRATVADTAAARRVLGWEPSIDLRRGLESQWSWHRDHVSGPPALTVA